MREHTETFKIENLTYELTMSRLGAVYFEMISGWSKCGSTRINHEDPYNLFPEYANLSDTGLLSNAMPLFRKVGEILCRWVRAYRPPRIAFSASTKRKSGIYRWFAAKLAQKFQNYNMVEFPDGTFVFYRHVNDVG
jgi:hypothetical protein